MRKIPAAMARIARIALRPPIPNSVTNPQAIRKMANNSMPIFLLNFIVILLVTYLSSSRKIPAITCSSSVRSKYPIRRLALLMMVLTQEEKDPVRFTIVLYLSAGIRIV
jgi:hypothetical protein